MSDFFDVDPANGSEPHFEPPPSELAFTAPEKISAVVREVLARPAADPKVGAILAVITSPIGDRFLLRPMLALLPPLDAAEEWDAWLAILAGCALELSSDGVELDVTAARDDARMLLQALFEDDPG